MTQKKLTDKELLATLEVLAECGNDRIIAAQKLGLAESSLNSRIRAALRSGLIDAPPVKGYKDRTIPDEDLQATVDAYARFQHAGRAADHLGLSRNTYTHRRREAERLGMSARSFGNVAARAPTVRPLPEAGKIARYVLTCAQSETRLHEPTWNTLKQIADHYGAEICVSTYTYRHRQEGSAKRGTSQQAGEDWYDERIEPHVVDDMVELAPGLVWNGHMNILPTAVDPLSGMDNYNFRASSIFPHAKVAMKSIPTIKQDPAKLQYTTGTATLRNYIQKKAGQKAEFDHVYGGLLVEVDDTGHWWVRQLISDSKGVIYDLDLKFAPTGLLDNNSRPEAIVWGDIHVAQLEKSHASMCWGDGGILDTLRPRRQYMHDIIDFESRSHHNRRDPLKMFELHVKGRESVAEECAQVHSFLKASARKGCTTYVVQSNHDRHLERWLKEADWRSDPVNAEFYTACAAAFMAAIRRGEYFNALEWAVKRNGKMPRTVWLGEGESSIICRDASGGIEMSLHGDQGPHGARGSIRNLSRLGRKVCIGHSHSAGIFNGAWQTGVAAKLDMDYARGAPSAWTHSHIIVQPNGKRQMLTTFGNKWRA